MNLQQTAALAAACALAVSCVAPRHPRLRPTDFPGLFVADEPARTVKEGVPGQGRWVMIVNRGEGRVYLPEDGKATSYDFADEVALTASGEVFDPGAMTGAHASLPLHTIVRVTRVDQPHEVVVRINDRAVKVEGRSIELTPSAARKLGLGEDGAAPCRIEVLQYPVLESVSPAPESVLY